MEKQLQPKLRFPEFSGDWTLKKIKDVAPLQRGFDLPSTQLILGDYPVVYSNGIQNYHNEFKVDGPGIVTGRSGTIGKIHYVKGKYWPHNTSLWVTDFKGNVPKYIYYFFLKLDFTKFNAGSTVPTLNRNDVHDLKRLIPSLPEQQKIADYLTTIDRKIELLTEKKTELSRYKKAMMQKLFAQEIRFKDENGNDYPEWEIRFFGDFYDVGSSKRVLQEDWKSSGIPFYRTRELVSLVNKTPFSNEIYISENLYLELQNKYGVPKQGDLLVSGVGTLGICYLIEDSNKFYFKDGNVIWFKKTGQICSKFILYSFQERFVLSQIMNNASITTVGTYTIQNAKKTKFKYPSLPEQQKIANFLSAIDDNIVKVEEQIKETQNFKKAMLQQLFV